MQLNERTIQRNWKGKPEKIDNLETKEKKVIAESTKDCEQR